MTHSSLPHNPDAQPFWDGAKQHKLLLKKCRGCAHVHFPPRHLCPRCWSDALNWIEASGGGRIYSHTVVRRAPTAAFAARAPYALALITLEEGPRFVANIAYDSTRPLAIDDLVHVYFEDAADGTTLPQFRRIESA
jgi:uncharacterized OB-fold protein